MKRLCLYAIVIVLALMGSGRLMAQTPVISGLDKAFAPVNDTLTIGGSGFGSNAANIEVFFGSVAGTVVSIIDSQIEVLVPASTTFSSVSVINTVNGLIGYSPQLFFISFGGNFCRARWHLRYLYV